MTIKALFAIAGAARSGKNTIAELHPQYKTMSFAEELKKQAEKALKSIDIYVDLIHNDAQKVQWRGLLVDLGEWRRNNETPDYWVNIVTDKIRQMDSESNDYYIAITDTRYVNECRAIKSMGGKVLYVCRRGVEPPNLVERKSLREVLSSGLVDFLVENNGTLDELKANTFFMDF